MAKKGNRLREFEKNNRVLDISSSQEARRKKKSEKIRLAEADAAAEASGKTGGNGGSGGSGSGTGGAGGSGGSGKKRRINWIRMGSIIISLVFIVAVGLSVKNIFDLKEREAALQERNRQLLRIKEELTMELENVHTDEYIEELARRELKLVKGNELIFYFPDDFQLQRPERESQAESDADADPSGADTAGTTDTADTGDTNE